MEAGCAIHGGDSAVLALLAYFMEGKSRPNLTDELVIRRVQLTQT